MKKNIFSIIILLIFSFEVLTHANSVIECVRYSYQIWINDLFPSLFPFFVISELLINYGFVELLSKLFNSIFHKLFKINGNTSFIFFMSLLSGLPSNAKYARELYLKQKITAQDASKILIFTHFANPLFILGTISHFLNSKYLGYIVIISHYLGNIILGLVFRNDNKENNNNSQNKKINNKPLGIVIANAVSKTTDTLLLILGVTTVFLIISNIVFSNFNLPIYLKTFISCFLEMTQGLKYISTLDISNIYKAIMITATLSFGGLSVHMQVAGILSDTEIKYTPFLLARILHSIISTILCIFILNL